VKPFLALLTAVVGIAIVILAVSCGGGGDHRKLSRPPNPLLSPSRAMRLSKWL